MQWSPLQGAPDQPGPPGGLPDPVPDFVGDILGSIGEWLNDMTGNLGEIVSGIAGGGSDTAGLLVPYVLDLVGVVV